MPTDSDDNRRNESRRILDRISKEADSSGFAQMRRRSAPSADGRMPVADDDDPLDAWATKVGRTLGLVITIGLMIWLLLYVLGKV